MSRAHLIQPASRLALGPLIGGVEQDVFGGLARHALRGELARQRHQRVV